MSVHVGEATVGDTSSGEGEAAMIGVLDLAVALGLVVVVVGLCLRWRRNRRQQNTFRKLSVSPKLVSLTTSNQPCSIVLSCPRLLLATTV